jgi:uncharacterized protein YprB with RNaseH-like and TPR domain
MGIERPPELQGFTGADAVRQWNRWRHRRDESARELLVAYNEADCVNLEPLADAFYCQLIQSIGLSEVWNDGRVDGASTVSVSDSLDRS